MSYEARRVLAHIDAKLQAVALPYDEEIARLSKSRDWLWFYIGQLETQAWVLWAFGGSV